MDNKERDIVLNAIFMQLELSKLADTIEADRYPHYEKAASYLAYLRERVHAEYDLWVIRDELGLPKPKAQGRFSR